VPTPGCIEAVTGLIIKSLERDIARRRFASDQGSRRCAMNDEHSEYLRQAAFCRGMAVEANTLERKAAWLRLASKWLALAAEESDHTAHEPFDPIPHEDGSEADLEISHQD